MSSAADEEGKSGPVVTRRQITAKHEKTFSKALNVLVGDAAEIRNAFEDDRLQFNEADIYTTPKGRVTFHKQR